MYKKITTMALLMLVANTNAQEPDFDSIARNIVAESAEVQPGEVVLIRGSVEALEIFEALVAQTIIAGGQPIPFIEFPEATNKATREAPLDYLRQEHTAELSLLGNLDVYIEATPGFNPAEFLAMDVPRERLIAAQQGRASYFEAASRGSWREVYIGQSSGVLTPSFADFSKANFDEMGGIFWQAVSIAPGQLDTIGSRITNAMTEGADVHLTGPHGSDLRFKLSYEPATISTGKFSEKLPASGPAQMFLPAGEFAACVDPSSANGTLYVPMYTFRAEDVVGMTLIFEGGVIKDMSAESGGEPLREFLDALDTPARALSLINIGFNPRSRISSGSSYRSWEMSGVVTALVGDNTIYQCSHAAGNRFHPHVEGLTLTTGGIPVVMDGKVQ